MNIRVTLAVASLCAVIGAGPGMAASPTKVGAQSKSVAASDHSVTYYDAVGDTVVAPDISGITVSLIGNRLTFRVGVANLGPGLVDSEFLTVNINTDRNASTGCSGTEVYLAMLGQTYGGEYPRLGRCVGGSSNFKVPQGSFSSSISPGFGTDDPGVVSFSLDASELGTTNFTFRVGSEYGTGDDFDFAGPFSFGASSPPANPPGKPSSSTKRIVITRKADVRAEATGPTGASVTYAPATVRGAKTVSYSRRSGTIFPLGKTTVTITARNGARVAHSTFAVIVADTTKPTIVPLSSVSTNATDPTSALVTFGPITATDRVDPNVPVTCIPASGSVLAPGTTNVACTARDHSGNTAATVFRVAVPVYANQMSLQTNTTYQYDGAGHLVGATTAITIAVPPAPDGSPVTYTWAASSGTIVGNGLTASWVRPLDTTGQPTASSVTVTLTFATGRTEIVTIQFP